MSDDTASPNTTHTHTPLLRREHKRQLVHLVPVLANETDDLPSRRRRERAAVAGSGARRDGPARARRRLDVEVARVAVLLALAEHRAGPELAARERERRRVAAGAAVRERRTVREREADAVEARRAAERERRGLQRARLGRERGGVAEPRPVRAAPEAGLLEAGGGIGEVDVDRVVVGEDAAVGLEEESGRVVEAGRVEVHERTRAEEELVDRLARVRRARVVAERLDGGRGARALEVEPRVREAGPGRVLRREEATNRGVCRASVARVGITEDENSIADAVGGNVGRNLLNVRVARSLVAVFGAGIGVEVVDVDVDLGGAGRGVGDAHAHESEALRREAVVAGRVGANVPLDALKIDPVEVGESIEAAADGSPTGSGRTVGVVIGCVDVCVVIEVLER